MTPAADRIQLELLLARTDRGELWRSASGTLVRLLEPRFCDTRFRERLERLRSGAYPSMVQIGATGWHGMKFYVEYAVQENWLLLPKYWEGLHWRTRLPFLRQVCELLPEWGHAGGYPVGIDPSSIVAVEIAGRWFPWILPCPPVAHASPFDFLECDEAVLACVPPETIRGLLPDGRSQDAYSLGILAWQALGARQADPLRDPSGRLEAQACGWMLNCCVEATAIEPFLQPLTEVIGLAGLAARYTQLDFVARPTTPAQLALACDAAFAATEPLRLAQQLFQSARSHDALKVVDWGLATFKPSLQLHLLGASIAEKLEDFGRATEYLDGAIMLKPTDLGLRFRRCDLRWWVYRHRPGPTPPRLDAEGEALLQDLEICKQLRTDRHASEPYVRRAFVFRQSGNLNAAAEELYQATELEQSDIAVVYEYAKVLAELKQPELVRAALAEGIKRADLMVKAGMMEKSEAQTWRDLFDSLLRG